MKGKMIWTLLTLSIVLISCGSPKPTQTTMTTNPEPSRIRFVYDNPPAWRQQAARFTEETGVLVEYEEVPFPQLHNRYQTALMGGSYDFDVLHVMDLWVKEWGPKGWLIPLEDLVPREIVADYPEGVLDNLRAVDAATGKEHLYGLPLYYWITNFYYRTDLFEQAGLKPPVTMSEMREAARIIKEKFGIYGFSTTLANPTNVFGIILRGEGTEVLVEGQPSFNNQTGLSALELLIGMADDGSIDPASFEAVSSIGAVDMFIQGGSAMAFGPPPTLPMANDPDQSRVVGKVGVALVPGGSVNRTATYHETGGRAIPYNAKDSESAWQYIRWVISFEEMVFIATDPGLGRVPARKTALNDHEVKEKYELMSMVDQQLSGGPNGMVIVHERGTEISEALGRNLIAAIMHEKTAAQALADAEKEILTITTD